MRGKKSLCIAFLLLACVAHTVAMENRTFHLLNQRLSFEDARNFCRETFDDLAIFQTVQEAQVVLDLANQTNEKVWIGGVYSKNQFGWVTNETMRFTCLPWETSNSTMDYCGTLNPVTEMWELRNCDDKSLAVCLNINRTLQFVKEKKTWKSALQYCRDNYTDLVSISYAREQRQVTQFLLSVGSPDWVWLGLKKHMAWGYWYWTDDQPLQYYSFWADGQPSDPFDERCGVAGLSNGSYRWYDTCCEVPRPFVCY
ncbi:C-type lectin domain family 4 member D-like isoform X2 [Amia ocellicauda]|uniref:C-type lectin domain family 4 member D-like isoform X2 n=1 Tax=Amia ocellicauda TaxID=2972642 RepID=UPI003464151F